MEGPSISGGGGDDDDAEFAALLAQMRDGGVGAQFEAELQQELDALERREAAARRVEVRLRRFEPEPGGRDAGAAGPSAAGAKRRLAAWRRMLQERGMDETLRAAEASKAPRTP